MYRVTSPSQSYLHPRNMSSFKRRSLKVLKRGSFKELPIKQLDSTAGKSGDGGEDAADTSGSFSLSRESPSESFKVFGDPVDILKYDIKDYNSDSPDGRRQTKICHLILMERKESKDETDDTSVKEGTDETGSKVAEAKNPDEGPTYRAGEKIDDDPAAGKGSGAPKAKMGFNLMSVTCLRGHFVDDVEVSSLAAEAGLEDGDLLVSIEGQSVRDMPHEDVVNLLSSITLGGNYQDKIELVLIPAHQVRNAT